ncbi:MAG: hypothetical protein WCP39_01565 [Chlamydiota bacterium]
MTIIQKNPLDLNFSREIARHLYQIDPKEERWQSLVEEKLVSIGCYTKNMVSRFEKDTCLVPNLVMRYNLRLSAAINCLSFPSFDLHNFFEEELVEVKNKFNILFPALDVDQFLTSVRISHVGRKLFSFAANKGREFFRGDFEVPYIREDFRNWKTQCIVGMPENLKPIESDFEKDPVLCSQVCSITGLPIRVPFLGYGDTLFEESLIKVWLCQYDVNPIILKNPLKDNLPLTIHRTSFNYTLSDTIELRLMLLQAHRQNQRAQKIESSMREVSSSFF